MLLKGQGCDALAYMYVVFLAYFDIDLHVKHVAGPSSTTTDQLSRNYMHPYPLFPLLSSTGILAITPTPTTTTGNSVLPETGLEITSLQHAVQRYYHMGLAQSTWKSYTQE